MLRAIVARRRPEWGDLDLHAVRTDLKSASSSSHTLRVAAIASMRGLGLGRNHVTIPQVNVCTCVDSAAPAARAKGLSVCNRVGRAVALLLAFSASWILVGCKTDGSVPAPILDAKGEEEIWTIRCGGLRGQDQRRVADGYGALLRKVPGLKGELVYVHHDADESIIYYGKYRREYDALGNVERYKPNHLPELKLIRELSLQSDGRTVWPFLDASMDAIPTLQSKHPEWDLERVTQADAYWSLHVGVFYNNEQLRKRRAAAEEYCALLRKEGDEAYYHHGASNSSVYVGLFPKRSIIDTTREDALSGLPTAVRQIVDERMLKVQAKYPVSLHNGHQLNEVQRDSQTGAVTKRQPVPSFPVVIPAAQAREQFGVAPRRKVTAPLGP